VPRGDSLSQSAKIDPVEPRGPHGSKLEIEAIDEHIDEQSFAVISHGKSFPQPVDARPPETDWIQKRSRLAAACGLPPKR
jgi:hypothetical protein